MYFQATEACRSYPGDEIQPGASRWPEAVAGAWDTSFESVERVASLARKRSFRDDTPGIDLLANIVDSFLKTGMYLSKRDRLRPEI